MKKLIICLLIAMLLVPALATVANAAPGDVKSTLMVKTPVKYKLCDLYESGRQRYARTNYYGNAYFGYVKRNNYHATRVATRYQYGRYNRWTGWKYHYIYPWTRYIIG